MKVIHTVASLLTCTMITLTTPAFAAPTESIGSGTTVVKFDSTFVNGLRDSGVRVSKVEESTLTRNTLTSPVIEGAIDLADARGEIMHSGGLRLLNSTAAIRLLNFVIDTTGLSPVLTAEVVVSNSLLGRIVVFDITLPSLSTPLRVRNGTLRIRNATLLLSADAADTLNSALGITDLQQGQSVGQATLNLRTGRSTQPTIVNRPTNRR